MPPRLIPIDAPHEVDVAAALTGVMPARVPRLPLHTIAHHPRALALIRASSGLGCGSLDRRPREIVTLRTAARCGCESEWRAQLSFFAARVGLRKKELAAIVYGGASDPAWSEPERTLIRLVDELHDTARISDALWTELRRHWSDAQLVECVVGVGLYHAISFVVNGLGVALESPAAPAPPPVREERIREAELEVTRA
jgi:alkylhydroperoxidase family enzyme